MDLSNLSQWVWVAFAGVAGLILLATRGGDLLSWARSLVSRKVAVNTQPQSAPSPQCPPACRLRPISSLPLTRPPNAHGDARDAKAVPRVREAI